jgi:hypothetical protein
VKKTGPKLQRNSRHQCRLIALLFAVVLGFGKCDRLALGFVAFGGICVWQLKTAHELFGIVAGWRWHGAGVWTQMQRDFLCDCIKCIYTRNLLKRDA